MQYNLDVIRLFFISTLLCAADLTVDHVTVAGRDLKQMEEKLRVTGLRAEYGGPHNNRATEMALVSFPDGSYLELIALQPKADPQAVAAHYWSKQMLGNGGPAAWAVRSNDVRADAARVKAAGVTTSEPVRAGRERPDKTKLEWETARIGPEPNGTFFPFLIRDFTPRPLRAMPSGKPSTDAYSGISRVVIAVRDLNASVARYRKAYSLPAATEQTDAAFGARLAMLPGTPVILAMPLNAQSWLNARLAEFGEGPCAFLVRPAKGFIYSPTGESRWFGATVLWFDVKQLGWRLGREIPAASR